ncbi:hypothetical protein JNB_06474 [Janibacter sp. HTCC2649]|uniref:hypothetical protein n=1 Tax=Janibacter sp. HTCC2649 TaxID=313589 RepID=UPI0000670BEC|nr:hypothetical protein [Janibacter sp. HTCC2649]EAP99792.1 hypothetical protein JNB_06474 [Janibacter sp. HTCC2649]
MSIEVNIEGVKGLQEAVRMNKQYLAKAHTFVTDNCSNFGAFTGFLDLFEGDYREAYGQVDASLAKGVLSAGGIAQTIGANLKQYRHDDVESSTRLKGIEVKVDLPSISGTDPSTGLPIVEVGKYGATATDDVTDKGDREYEKHQNETYKHRGDNPRRSHGAVNPLAPINVADDVQELFGSAGDINDANDDAGDYDDFENGGKR